MVRSVSALSIVLALTLSPSSSSGQSSGTASGVIATPTLDSCTALARKSLQLNVNPPGLSPAAVEEQLRRAFLRIRDAKDVEAMLACIMRRTR